MSTPRGCQGRDDRAPGALRSKSRGRATSVARRRSFVMNGYGVAEVALVTGAGRGIGRAIADALAAAGFRVARVSLENGAEGSGRGGRLLPRRCLADRGPRGPARPGRVRPRRAELPREQRRRDLPRARGHARPDSRELRPHARDQPARRLLPHPGLRAPPPCRDRFRTRGPASSSSARRTPRSSARTGPTTASARRASQ